MLSKGSLLEAGLGLDSLRSAMITYSCTVPLEKLLIKTRTSTFQQRSQVDSSELPTLRIRSVAGFFFFWAGGTSVMTLAPPIHRTASLFAV